MSIGNGWYISWDHAKHGGPTWCGATPDGGQMLDLRRLDVARVQGEAQRHRLHLHRERIDSIIDFTSVYFPGQRS